MKDGQMFHVLSYGQNNMPSYASQLSRDDRWNVIVYLRSLQSAAIPMPQASPVKVGEAPTLKPSGGQP